MHIFMRFADRFEVKRRLCLALSKVWAGRAKRLTHVCLYLSYRGDASLVLGVKLICLNMRAVASG